MTPRFNLAAVILAAGKSTRMGRPKLLLPWKNTTVLGHLIDLWSQLPKKQIAVICASDDDALAAELDRLQFPREQCIMNPHPERGMFSSVRCAAQWPNWQTSITHWAVCLGDQPGIHSSTLDSISSFAAQNPENICQPARLGHGRHPVILPRIDFEALAKSDAQTLRDFLQDRAAAIKSLELSDPGLDFDLDYPTDYEAAKS
ncbi:MAG TPA: nucleotidyltransferase family protein [Verrucomicrobiae bacterium]|jgi:molybdenum cofactor cytidylyltransferase|nr:nucleotidyltransferase family protein [Verrucomicrobiae bacterium]